MIEIDIQMPQKCGSCPCFHAENPMYCQAVKADKNKKIVAPYGLPRPEWCPLKEQEAIEPRRIDGKRNHFIKCGNCRRWKPEKGYCLYNHIYTVPEFFCADGEHKEIEGEA